MELAHLRTGEVATCVYIHAKYIPGKDNNYRVAVKIEAVQVCSLSW